MQVNPAVRLAATVVLLRDGAQGVETFLMRRHGQSGFMAGATVFPGGKLDDADAVARTSGLTPEGCAERLEVSDAAMAWRVHVAAIRELHEEAHVLLARDAAGRGVDAATVAALEARLAGARQGHHLPAQLWHAAVAELGLTLALDALSPFANWLTPRAEPRRFDTWFFVAEQPAGQVAQLDLHEASDAFWLTPQAALTDHDAVSAILLPPPTLHTLLRMAALPQTAADIVRGLTAAGIGACVEPHFAVATAEGPAILLPEDPEHPEHASWRQSGGSVALRSRFLLTDGRFAFVRA